MDLDHPIMQSEVFRTTIPASLNSKQQHRQHGDVMTECARDKSGHWIIALCGIMGATYALFNLKLFKDLTGFPGWMEFLRTYFG